MRHMFFSIVVLPQIFCISCTSKPKHGDIRQWSQKYQDEEPYHFPSVSVFSNKDKKLIFVGVKHTLSKNSPTFKTIKKVFSDFKFDSVVLEAGKYEEGVNSKRVIDLFPVCLKENFSSQCGESYYSACLSSKKGVDFFFAEPNDKDVFNLLKSKNYDSDDFLYYYLSRNIPQWKMQGLLNREDFTKQAVTFLNRYTPQINESAKTNIDSYLTWLKVNAGFRSSMFDLEYSDVEPKSISPTYLQTITNHVSVFRESFIVEVINQLFQRYESILVVYGAYHLTSQRPYWESKLGPAKNYKFFGEAK